MSDTRLPLYLDSEVSGGDPPPARPAHASTAARPHATSGFGRAGQRVARPISYVGAATGGALDLICHQVPEPDMC
jgi:hypothetical protein